MNPLEKIIAGGSTLQGKPLHGGAANHLKTPTFTSLNLQNKLAHRFAEFRGGEGTHP